MPTPKSEPAQKTPKVKKVKKFKYRDGYVELDREIYDRIYNFAPRSGPIGQYLGKIEEITAMLATSPYTAFSDLLKKENPKFQKAFKQRTSEGVCLFEDLMLMFIQDQEVLIDEGNFPAFGARILKVSLQWGFGLSVKIEYECVSVSNGTPGRLTRSLRIYSFSGTRAIQSLPCRPLLEKKKQELQERGQRFKEYVTKPTHLICTGNLLIGSWFGYRRFKSLGRVMIDAQAMKQSSPDYHREYGDEDRDQLLDVPDSLLWMTESRVYGFSFSLKKWGEFSIEDLAPVNYRKDAYTKLVLDEDVKRAVLSLVGRGGQGFSDVIEGKGGGCIFLLHGNPGLGKTMTAEAVADYLGRPLYSISAGELGVEPSDLESSLRDILDIASTWNAVILLDEADVYLEQRDEKDVVRNAMVGVFLRMLEYHSGVLFLTTNRVRHFDKAFFSRITMILHYPDMTPSIREKVWTNLLDAAGIHHITDTSRLAALDLNGRQIKNTVRAAQALAGKQDISEEDLFTAIRITTEGAKDLVPHLST